MSLVTALFARGNRRQRRAIPSIRLERLEVRRALAADDGSDPWDGYVPPEDDGVEVDTWVDPGDIVTFNLPSDDGGDGAGDGLPQCWLPPVDDEGNPIPEPFWRSGPGAGGPDYGFLPPPDDALVTQVITPWVNAVTGEVFLASTGGWTAPSDDWVIDYSVFPVDGWSGDEAGPGESGGDPGSFWGDDVWFGTRPYPGDLAWCFDGTPLVGDDGEPITFTDDGAPVPVAGGLPGDGMVALPRLQWGVDSVGFFQRVTALADDCELPPVVIDVVADPQPDGSVDITWTDVPPEVDVGSGGYVVQYRRLRDTEWTTYPGATIDEPLAELTGLEDGANYVVRTVAVGLGGIAAVSAPSRPFTYEGPSQRPTDVVATPTADGIVVTWNDPFANQGEGGPAIDGYVVEARRLRDTDWTSVGTVTGATTSTVSGLDAAAHYAFRVTKTNIGMTQVLSAPSRPSRPVTTASVVGISAETTATGGARISWDGAAAGAGEQVVEYRRLAATDWVRVGAFPAASGVATVDGLPGGRHYTFRILSAGGVYTPRTRAVTLPTEVDYLLGAATTATGAVVTWTDPLAATRTDTVIEYRRLKDSVWSALGSVASATGEMKVDGLVPNANYVFRLRQVDAAGLLSRTVATRPVTVSPICVFPPPACVDFPGPGPGGGSFLVVNPGTDGSFATEISGIAPDSGDGSSGTLVATGQFTPVGGGTGTLVLGSAGGAG
ncbi:MAG: fibronectin type III domain-containing protein [Planctomycetes bacterium]|nr:fibronectin type III domain-containing protein [Planctomycetota bacterium]